MAEKTLIKFLTPVNKGENGKIRTSEFLLKYIEYDEETTKRLHEQMAEYEVYVSNSYKYEDDDYGTTKYGSSSKSIRVDKLTSNSSMMYSTDEPQADALVIGGQFLGVVIPVFERGGNGWSNYDNSSYCILYTDGRISGSNKSYYSYSGESSSKDDDYTYTLQKVKED